MILVSMAVFRSPAVALMPDVTLKPLRSKANAVINLMGSAGGILVLILGMVFATSAVRNSLMSYTGYFGVIAAVMLAALVVFMLTVREPEWAAEMREQSVALGLEESGENGGGGGRRLSMDEIKSLVFILLSIVLWFFGYNAVTSKYSVYASNILHKDYNLTLIIAQAAAIVAYLPVGFIASKVGRKKTILAGVLMLTAAFTVASFLNASSPTMLMNAMFALAGIAWATINVNSFPMVVEMCSGGDVGKYTGFYYTASMAAQVATPMLSGLLMDKLGMHVLFPYAAAFTALAFVTMLFVRHGDSCPEAKKGLDALEVWTLLLRCRRGHPGWKLLRQYRYAHRGYHDKPHIPENSMAAFHRAIENGFGAELDVHLLKDGHLAVIHDASLKRTAGADVLVEDLTSEELKAYRLEGTDERIPLIDEVLALF